MSATDARKSDLIWRQENMSKSKKEVNLGLEQPKVKTAAKSAAKNEQKLKLDRSAASKAVWANPALRKKISDAIRKSLAARKAAAAKA
jgi:hypothetical protein